MKLLVLTQAVDTEDPILGFMHRWIEEIAKNYEHVEVICLKSGRFNLPSNVRIHSLGKPHSAPPSLKATDGRSKASAGRGKRTISRIKYVSRFYSYIFSLRHDYDAVFVHMNQEYVLLGGLFWYLWGKPVVLWRNHKLGLFTTRIAAALSCTVCYTSPSAYAARFSNAVQMPIGIDTEHFRSIDEVKPHRNSILFLGRIDEVKRPLLFIDALKALVTQGVPFHADIYGDPTYPNDLFFATFKSALAPLQSSCHVTLHPSSRNSDNPAIYSAHSVYVNLTPSGSFDKTIGEAMACGAIVVTANSALRGILLEKLIAESDDGAQVARAIKVALELSSEEREQIVRASREYVDKKHSLRSLVDILARLYSNK